MFKRLTAYFDKLEDKVRIRLSHAPVLYSLIGAVGIILIWKGVWETAEIFPVLHGPASILLGVAISLVSGLFVSFFIGDSIILSGYKKEKKLAEKTEAEVKASRSTVELVMDKLESIEDKLEELEAHPSGGARQEGTKPLL